MPNIYDFHSGCFIQKIPSGVTRRPCATTLKALLGDGLGRGERDGMSSPGRVNHGNEDVLDWKLMGYGWVLGFLGSWS